MFLCYKASYQIWVRVPMQAPQSLSQRWLNVDACEEGLETDDDSEDDEDFGEDTWKWFVIMFW